MNRLFLATAGLLLLAAACKPPKMDTYEKNLEIPGHEWTYDYKPSFEVKIQPEDTAYLYNIYVNIRHTDAYPYSNIWLLVGTQTPAIVSLKNSGCNCHSLMYQANGQVPVWMISMNTAFLFNNAPS